MTNLQLERNSRKLLALSTFIILSLISTRISAQTSLPAGFHDTTLDLGFPPSALAIAPDGRVFVADEDGGAVRVVKNGALLPTPFLTIAVSATVPNTHGYEGLTGIAIDPGFPANPYIYLHYTSPSTNLNRVSRFTVSGSDPDIGDPASELILFNGLPTIHAHHIHFGADGKLYVGVGGVHSAGREQQLNSYEGKVLRLNPDGSIPSDNPVFADPTALPGIWAYGLRNPFSFAVDPATGQMHINDVGESTWEEINIGVSGADYGWPSCEGTCADGFVNPLFQYPHSNGQCAITGGAFYRGSTFPSQFTGVYFFLDHCADWIRYLDTDNNVQNFATGTPPLTLDMAVGPDGSLYYLSRESETLQKIEYCGDNCPAGPVTYEAEDLSLSNGNVASTNCVCSNASSGECARNEGSVGVPALASTLFTGPGGLYQVDVRYCDESDDVGATDSYGFSINGVEQTRWFSSNGAGSGEIWRTESLNVSLATGDLISIDSTRGGTQSWSRVDKFDLIALNSSCGNGTVDEGEVCELGEYESCTDGAGYSGTQSCNATCTGYDACATTEFCGDGIIQATAGESCDDGQQNGTEGFCNAQCTGPTGTAPSLLEAEDMFLSNGNVASSNCICGNPSAGQCARNEAAVGDTATASTSHTGSAGVYQIGVTYCDESDDGGAPDSYELFVNGNQQGSWLSSNGSGAGQAWQTEFFTVTLANGDLISIDSTRGGSLSWARLDKIELTDTGSGGPPSVLSSVLITPSSGPQMTVNPTQGFSLTDSAFTAEAFDQNGELIEASFSCTISGN